MLGNGSGPRKAYDVSVLRLTDGGELQEVHMASEAGVEHFERREICMPAQAFARRCR
jgi:hypothetical protein